MVLVFGALGTGGFDPIMCFGLGMFGSILCNDS
jgi:hypothetical protein